MLQQNVQPAIRIKEDYVATWKESVATQSSFSTIQSSTTLTRQIKSLSQQQSHATGRNSIMIKRKFVAIEIENNN